MKHYTLLAAALLSSLVVTTTYAEHTQADHKAQSVKVTIKTDGNHDIEKLTVDGKKIDIDALKAFVEAYQAEAKTDNTSITLAQGMTDHKKVKKSFVVKNPSTLHNRENKTVEVFVDDHDGQVTEKVIINGKELSEDEIAAFKSSGQMKVLHLGDGAHDQSKKKVVYVNSDSHTSDIDLDVIIDMVSEMDDGDAPQVLVKSFSQGAGVSKKLIKKRFKVQGKKHASLGFTASVEKDGWHISHVVNGSGADEAGIESGDVIQSIAGVNLVDLNKSESTNVALLPDFEEGEIVKVTLDRDGEILNFDVEARDLGDDLLSVSFSGDEPNQGLFNWVGQIDSNNLLNDIKVMVFDGEADDFQFNEEDIQMIFPKDLSDMNIFISDGRSTSNLLGENHEMSSMSEGLSRYFNTSGGVLVLHVDDNNAFALNDGDVIKSVNKQKVNSPKEVVKALVLADDQKSIQLKVIRNKSSKILKYQK